MNEAFDPINNVTNVNNKNIVTQESVSDDTRKYLDSIYAKINSIKNENDSDEEVVKETEEVTDEDNGLIETQKKDEQDDGQKASETSSEEDSKIEGESDVEPESSKATKAKDRSKSYYKLLAEKKALLEENNKIQREKENLKNLLGQSYNSNTYYFSRSAYQEHEKAVDDLKKAMSDGDTEAFIKANQNFIRSQNNLNKLEEWEAQEKEDIAANERKQALNKVEQETNPQSFDEHMIQIAEDWKQGHPYLKEESPNFNEKLANEVYQYVIQLDTALTRDGYQNFIFSPEYFETLDRNIEKMKRKYYESNKNKVNNLNHIGSVKNSNMKLSAPKFHPVEEQMMKRLNMNPEEWVKYRKEYEKKSI